MSQSVQGKTPEISDCALLNQLDFPQWSLSAAPNTYEDGVDGVLLAPSQVILEQRDRLWDVEIICFQKSSVEMLVEH